ncbi:ribonuclease H-like domain-containing protein [Daedaleopsis nitida]|nr:ribonuclease H-like domain-containing protein [Daedaleopsis nitida]
MLILDVKTRWSSMHQMMERAVLYQDAINMTVTTAPKDAKLSAIVDPEWEAIKLVQQWLGLFREATTTMSTTKAFTLSSVQAVFRDLQDHLRTAYSDLPPSVRPSVKEGLLRAHRKLSDYYFLTDASPYYIWATSLDPRISLSGALLDCRGDASDSEAAHVRKCKELLEQHYLCHYAAGRPDSLDTGTSVTSVAASTPTSSPAKPTIQRCAVAVERIFSSGRDTVSLCRASLKPNTIRSLMLLKQRLLLAHQGASRMLSMLSSKPDAR